MHKRDGALVYSPTDLVTFYKSPFASWMNRLRVEDPEHCPKPQADDAFLQALAQEGDKHEDALLVGFEADGNEVVVISREATAKQRTDEAIANGAPLIHQACIGAQLGGQRFEGYADFLERVDSPDSQPQSARYIPLEAKLARDVKPHFILQACCYCDILENVQGWRPDRFRLLLGTGDDPTFRTEEHFYHYLEVRDRFLELMATWRQDDKPEPRGGDHGRWSEHAEQLLAQVDHLSRVAGMRWSQVDRLAEVGITTVAELAAAPLEACPKRMNERTWRRLRAQARLQKATEEKRRASGPDAIVPPEYEVLAPDPEAPGRGLGALPPASPGDVFFDLEGYPLAENGLEYLWGAAYLENREAPFRAWWAHDATEEKLACEKFLDWAYHRWLEFPRMHVYIYNHYETTALKRLTSRYATRVDVLDELLRNHVFVDLYKVTRQGLVIGEPSYSIKYVERLYRPPRTGDVIKADQSVVDYHRWRLNRDGSPPEASPILEAIRAYNEDDCQSTRELADWLRERQAEHEIEFHLEASPVDSESRETARNGDGDAPQPAYRQLDTLADHLHQRHEPGSIGALLADVCGFHWREKKTLLWRMLEWMDADPEALYHDPECLGDVKRVGAPVPVKRSLEFEYSFDPEQLTKLKAKDRVAFAPEPDDVKARMTVRDVDLLSGRVTLRIGRKKLAEVQAEWPQFPPEQASLWPDGGVSDKALQEALLQIIGEWDQTGELPGPLAALLNRDLPLVDGVVPGSALADESRQLEEQVCDVVAGMQSSVLCIQGPPGTGKTHVGAAAILSLIRQGKRVAVTALSHKAIVNLLRAVLEQAEAAGLSPDVAKIGTTEQFEDLESYASARCEKDAENAHNADVVGATVYQLARAENAGAWDYLFIDEAGQVALANLIAASRCAANFVLLGDQMQLSQPTRAAHPGDSGASALAWLLGDRAVVEPARGIFLGESWRMHPELCAFVSDIAYESKLRPRAGCEHHVVTLSDTSSMLPGAPDRSDSTASHPQANAEHGRSGLLYVPVAHEGNSQSSEAEADAIAGLVDALEGAAYVNERGDASGSLGPDDILIVAPYNLQVRLLEKKLAGRARIGTVDRFQGQQAPVVIVSMTSSDVESIPRGLEFLLDRRRLNVAISRAQCLTAIVASPALARAPCTSVKQMAQLNVLCKVMRSRHGETSTTSRSATENQQSVARVAD